MNLVSSSGPEVPRPRKYPSGVARRGLGRSWLLLVCLAGGVAGAGGVVVAQDVPAQEFRRQVFGWVAELDSGDPATQAAAEQALRNAGLPALPLLTNVDFDTHSPKARAALVRVRDQLLADRLQQEREPTRVSVWGTLSARQAFDSLGEQAHVTIVGGESATQPLEFRLQQVEFWRAFDTILAAGRWELTPYGGAPGELRVIPSASGDPIPAANVAYLGPYRVAVEQTAATRSPNHPQLDQLVVTLGVQWEPRLKILAIRQPLGDVQVEWNGADGGAPQPLLPKNVEQTAEAAVRPGQYRAELPLPLQLPPRRAARLARLGGRLQLLVAGPPESFAFANLNLTEQNLVRERGATSLQLLAWQTVPEGYQVDLALQVQNDDAVESFRQWPSECQVELDLGMGLALPAARQEILRQAEGGFAVRCLFTQDPSGMTLRFAAPLAVVAQEISYELREIILP